MSLSEMRISRKLALAFASILVVLLALSGIVVISISQMRSAVYWNNHTYEVLGKAEGIISGMVNQETGLRGYLVSGDEKFLQPYASGRKLFEDSFAAIKNLTSDNPAQQQRLDKIKSLADEWHDKVAEQEIGLMRAPATHEQARNMEASGAGKAAMDSLRAVEKELDEAERSLLTVRSQSLEHAADFAEWAMICGSVLAAALAVALGWALSRSIAAPIALMTEAMKSLARGDNSVEIPAVGRRDEVGEIAGAVQVFKEAAIEKIRLASEAEQTRRQAEDERHQNEAVRAEAAKEQAQGRLEK